MTKRILFYTTAGFSSGHRQRIINIATALRTCDLDVEVVLISPHIYAGRSWDSVGALLTEVELPNLVRDGLRPDWVPDGPEERGLHSPRVANARRETIRAAIGGVRHDVLVIEAFPFLTQHETAEVELLLELTRAANPRVKVICSVRDVLFGRRLDLAVLEARQAAERFIECEVDQILVHSDPSFIRLDDTYGDIPNFRDRLTYTGLVVPAIPPVAASEPAAHVVCSVGGRREWHVPTKIFLQVWSELRHERVLPPNLRGYLFVGLEEPSDSFREFVADYEDCFQTTEWPLTIGKWSEYRPLVASAACSVSQCSYNTTYELLRWGVPAVFVPRRHDGPDPSAEGEHPFRARKIGERGWGRIATDASSLRAGILACLHGPKLQPPGLDFSGADTTARYLLAYCG